MFGKYIQSNRIVSFPAGKRKEFSDNRDGGLITEARLASLANSLLDVNGFVISKSGSNLDEIKTLEVNILGRYFKITADPEDEDSHILDLFGTLTGATELFVGIASDSGNEYIDSIFDEILGQDVKVSDTYNYQGLRVIADNDSDVQEISGVKFEYLNNNTYKASVEIDQDTYKLYICVKIADLVDGNWIVPEPEMPKIVFIDGGTID